MLYGNATKAAAHGAAAAAATRPRSSEDEVVNCKRRQDGRRGGQRKQARAAQLITTEAQQTSELARGHTHTHPTACHTARGVRPLPPCTLRWNSTQTVEYSSA